MRPKWLLMGRTGPDTPLVPSSNGPQWAGALPQNEFCNTLYLGFNNQRRLLSRCYDIVTSSGVEDVVIHGDFGPHQIIVDSQSLWFLVDFEYAAIGPSADDLGGTEVRLEQAKFPNIDAFLTGYGGHRLVLTGYGPVRSAFKAYNLLAMLTYTIAHQDKEPPTGELKRLEQLLASL
jgi:hypothetical protein